MLTGEDQSQADQPNSLAEVSPVLECALVTLDLFAAWSAHRVVSGDTTQIAAMCRSDAIPANQSSANDFCSKNRV
eukprot:1156894-Pelagomonas_calceolata.AAC.16